MCGQTVGLEGEFLTHRIQKKVRESHPLESAM
jgi:hypothetical protein